MSVDDRLRQGLRANATAFEPVVERSLADVRRRSRRAGRARMTRAGAPVVAAAAVAALLAVVTRPGVLTDRVPAPSVTTPSSTAPSPTAHLFNRYEADVTRPRPLAGHWSIELRGNGSVLVIPPDGYAGVVSATIFTADQNRLRINLFAQDVCADQGDDGEYLWSRDGDRLVLDVSRDSCAPRALFFADNEWVVSKP